VGVSDFNAVTGKLVWRYQSSKTSQIVPPGPFEVISLPAISAPAGEEVVAFGDLHGAFHMLSLATGKQLYQRQTGSWISASPAVSNGDIGAPPPERPGRRIQAQRADKPVPASTEQRI
jgi:hypothetical protein